MLNLIMLIALFCPPTSLVLEVLAVAMEIDSQINQLGQGKLDIEE